MALCLKPKMGVKIAKIRCLLQSQNGRETPVRLRGGRPKVAIFSLSSDTGASAHARLRRLTVAHEHGMCRADWRSSVFTARIKNEREA